MPEERTIQEDINDLRNAVHGEDVREALIHAINLCYDDIVQIAYDYIMEHTQIGPQGKSAYQVAVDNGFVGTEEEWLATLVGPQGPPGEVHGDTITVDGEISGTSQNPVQNRVIKEALDGKMDSAPFSSNLARKIIVVSNRGKLTTHGGKEFGGDTFSQNPTNTKIPSELSVSNYTYSKAESNSAFATKSELNTKVDSSNVYDKTASDARYVQNTNVDSEISSTSTNPISNRAVYDAIQNIEISVTLPIDEELDFNSENAVQNRTITNLMGTLSPDIQQALMIAGQKTSRNDVFYIIDDVLTTVGERAPRLTVEEYDGDCWLVYYDYMGEEPNYLANISEVLNNLNNQ